MAEKIAKKLEKSMKKGFISMFILLILENGPSHGYKIRKEIENRTLGIWNPPVSTLYTLLKNLSEKELIISKVEEKKGRIIKNYAITNKGKQTLKLLLEKHQMIKSSMEALKTAMLGDEEEFLKEKMPMHGPFPFFFEDFNKKSDKAKIEFLELQKLHISTGIKKMESRLKRINKLIIELNKKIKEN
ncbi:MAG: PadR family transcriptional regulator [Candidatus Hermodarchaeota archaeon]